MKTVRPNLHSIRSGWRLLRGMLRLPSALRRGHSGAEKLISVDIFGTLIARSVEDDAAWCAGALECNAVALEHGLKPHPDPVRLRIEIERRMSRERAAAGQEPEFFHDQVFTEMLREMGAGDWAIDAAKQITEQQLQREIAWTYPVPAVVRWVEEQARAKKKLVGVSDTRYSGEQLAKILAHHQISGLSAIYASADHSASKFSGRLFDRVAELERVAPREILHAGDDILRDAFSPAQRGLAVRRVRPPERVKAPSMPAAPAAAKSDPAFLVGYEMLGPILVAFVRMLVDRAMRDGVRRLAFVARDGELPFRVAQILAAADSSAALPELRYVYLSRRSMACALPEFWRLQNDPNAVEGVIRILRTIRQMGTFLQGFETFFGLPSEWILRQAARLKLAAGNERDVRRLLSDPTAIAELQSLLAPMRARLNRYLANEQLLAGNTALVDIGWQGSLLKIVRQEAQAKSLPGPRGYFLGLWSDDSIRMGDQAAGLICDQRRSRSLHEGAAYHAAFLLEAVCRENQGVTIGYHEDADGTVRPIFMDAGATREAERSAEATQQAIREGVLAYARWFATSSLFAVPIDEKKLRREVQRRLFQLAFFPAANQRAVGQSLIHTEPTSDKQALALIATPGKGIRGWMRGLRSPWKGGYLYEHGGSLPATLYCFAEAVLSRLPGSKTTLRRWLIREG